MKISIPALLLFAVAGCGSQTQTAQTSSEVGSASEPQSITEPASTTEQAATSTDTSKSAEIPNDSPAGQAPPVDGQAPVGDLEQAAAELLQLMVAGDFAEATKDFDAVVSHAMPPDKLKQTWQGVTAQVGAWQKQTAVRRSQSGPHTVIDVDCEFEKSPLVFRLAFDQEQKIAGMFFLPPQNKSQANSAPAAAVAERGADSQTPARVGVWKPLKAELGGANLPDAVIQAMTLTLTADTYATKIDGGQGSDNGTYKVDEEANPKRMTIASTDGVNKGKTLLAIFEITDAGVLRICYDMTGKAVPQEFKTGQGTQLFLAEYRRQQTQAATPE